VKAQPRYPQGSVADFLPRKLFGDLAHAAYHIIKLPSEGEKILAQRG